MALSEDDAGTREQLLDQLLDERQYLYREFTFQISAQHRDKLISEKYPLGYVADPHRRYKEFKDKGLREWADDARVSSKKSAKRCLHATLNQAEA